MIYILLSVLIFLTDLSYSVGAQTPSSPSATSLSAIEALKAKLATKAAELRKDARDKTATSAAVTLRKLLIVGTIASVDKKSTVVKTRSGNKTIQLTQATAVQGGKITKRISDIKTNQRVVIVVSDSSEPASAQKVYLLPEKLDTEVVTVFGTVTESSAKKITVQNPKTKALVDINLDPKTTITFKGGAPGTASDIEVGTTVVVIIKTLTDEETQTALKVHITQLSGAAKANTVPNKRTATGSAQMQQTIKLAQQKLAGYLNVPASRLKNTLQENITWGDASLGVKEAGGEYAQVITPGYKFVFNLDNDQYEIHTDATGKSMVLVEPLKRF